MKSNCNKYRVSVYLGKELHEELAQMSLMIGVPIPTLIRLLLGVGKQFSDLVAKGIEKDNGKSKK